MNLCHMNSREKIENNETMQEVRLTINISCKTGTKEIKYVNLNRNRVHSFVQKDSILRFLLTSDDCWFYGTTQPYAYDIQIMEAYCKGQKIKNSHTVMGGRGSI